MKRRTKFSAALLGSAMAMFAAPAQSQSSVRLNGLLDTSVGWSKPPGGDSSMNVDSGKMTTSWVGMRGSEDLGGGLNAVFALEGFLRLDTGEAGRFKGDAFWARNAYVGIESKAAGRLALGRQTTPLFVSTLLFNAFGDSFGYSPSIRQYFTSGTTTGDTGWSDAIQYSSPSFGGLRFNVMAAAGEKPDVSTDGRNLGGNVLYFGGPLSATVAYQDVRKDGNAAVDDTRTWQLGGAYDFRVAKLFGQYGRVDNRTRDNEYRLVSVGTSVPVGPGKFLAQAGRVDPDHGAKRDTISIGYDWFVSKRTDLYAVAMHDKIEDISAGRAISLGIRHRF